MMAMRERKIIVFTISKPIIGGAQLWVSNLIRLLGSDYELHIITSRRGWLSDNCYGATVHYVSNLDGLGLTTFFRLNSCLKSISPDVVVSNSAFAGVYTRCSSIFNNFRNIYVSHGWSSLYKKGLGSIFFLHIERFLSHFTDYILCVSKSDVEKACNVIGIKKNKIKLISNSVFINSLDEKKDALKLPVGFNVVFVGRMEPPKRPDIFVSLLARLPDVNGYIVGEGTLRKDLALNKTDNITFLGEVSGFNNFNMFDLFVLSSDSEGLPMSAIQALSQGVPILISDVGGCSEVLSVAHPNGMLCENSLESFYSNFMEIYNNYDFYKKNSELARSEYDILNDRDKFDQLFN
tara:strand:+ start:11509 stop:12555 length:1047 start_codon:yes stop_codon:yes gene_type:complete